MSSTYRLQQDEPLPEGIKRIAREQLDRAQNQLAGKGDDREEAIHDARKCFKKVRAVLRLVRDEIGDTVYWDENRCFRDAARKLSDVRDSAVILKTFGGLAGRLPNELGSDKLNGIEKRLKVKKQQADQRIFEEENVVSEVAETIADAKDRVNRWPIEQDDFSALYDGLKRTYKRGRKEFGKAQKIATTENLHEWRKRVKYLWYHVRILKPTWPDVLNGLADSLHDLSDYLGDEHDLAELSRTISNELELSRNGKATQALFDAIEERRNELQSAAGPLGERIYFEKPSTFAKRIEAYWDA